MGDVPGSERRTVLYRGQVQGVGFRYRTCEIASRYAVSGFVRNLPDGRVEVVAEAARSILDRFLADMAQSLEVHILQAQTVPSAASGEFRGFEIRH